MRTYTIPKRREFDPRIDLQRGMPAREQTLLLRAALLDKDAAIEAWNEWRSNVDIERVDEGSHRLLPLLFRNLTRHGVRDPWMQRLRGVHRLTWYRNQLLFSHMLRLVRLFQQAGIETMVLKGAALILNHYKDYGLRPMRDFDLLIPTGKLSSAVCLLRENNWSSASWLPAKVNDAFKGFRHAQTFTDEAEREFDLHWHLMWECCEPDADEDFWKATCLTPADSLSVFALNPTDQLLHTCVHGVRGNSVPPVRWAADAMTVIHTAEIDWNRLLTQTIKRRLILQVRDALDYLRKELDAPVPQAIGESLCQARVSFQERLDFSLFSKPVDTWGVRERVWYDYRTSARWAKNSGAHRILGLPQYYQITWGLDHLWQVPLQMVYRPIRRIWNSAVRLNSSA